MNLRSESMNVIHSGVFIAVGGVQVRATNMQVGIYSDESDSVEVETVVSGYIGSQD